MTLSPKLQYQAIADRLSENGTALSSVFANLSLEDFSGICRICWQELSACDPPSPSDDGLHLVERLYTLTADHPERFEFLEQLRQVRPGAGWPILRSLEEMYTNLGQVQWLWPGWLPRGFITLLGAAAGQGKSLVALDLVRRLLDARPWPDQQPSPLDQSQSAVSPFKVIYIDAESAPQILRQRALAWQMDLGRLFPFVPQADQAIDLAQAHQREQLSEYCSLAHPDLVVLDALSSACWAGLSNQAGVKQLLAFLGRLAIERQIGVLVIHHLRKHAYTPRIPLPLALDDFFGSFYITAMSRLVIGLSPLPDRAGQPCRRLEVLKSNLAPFPPPLCLVIGRQSSGAAQYSGAAQPSGTAQPSDAAQYSGAAQLSWQPLSDSLASPSPAPASAPSPSLPSQPEWSEKESCMAWLLDLLMEEEAGLRVQHILLLGKQAGFGRRTIFRARRALRDRLLNTRGRNHPLNGWRLKL